jgi:hypothetical protein
MNSVGQLAKEMHAMRQHIEKGHLEKLVLAPIRTGLQYTLANYLKRRQFNTPL